MERIAVQFDDDTNEILTVFKLPQDGYDKYVDLGVVDKFKYFSSIEDVEIYVKGYYLSKAEYKINKILTKFYDNYGTSSKNEGTFINGIGIN